MQKRKLLYIGFSFWHHGEHTGYDLIQKYVDYNRCISCQRSFDFILNFLSSRTIISRVYGRFFGDRLWWVELKLIIMSLFNPSRYVFHIVYGENIYKYLGFFKFGNKIVLTLHQPPSFFYDPNRLYLIKFLKRVDRLIVMSQEMKDYFESQLPNVDVAFIPHGVDTSYFCPNKINKNRILMVGNWLRDFEFANKVFSEIQKTTNGFKVTIVTNKENHFHFNDQLFELYANKSDSELLSFYQSSAIVFLPLTQFTANNAILEAASVGCHIVVASNQETIDSNNNFFTILPLDVEVVSQYICKYLSENLFDEESVKTRDRIIKQFSWKVIGNKTATYLLFE